MENIFKQTLLISKSDREKLLNQKSFVVWLTGLSGSGKSTIANQLSILLHEKGKLSYILDGDNIRLGINKDLGFSDSDRKENIRRIAEISKLMNDAGLIVITAFISPFINEREESKKIIGEENFIEVFVDTPLDVCENRDPKGLYKKARAGQIKMFTGIDSPYEEPINPRIRVKTKSHSIDDCTHFIYDKLNLK
jgi:adenylyl-sulfate kinase